MPTEPTAIAGYSVGEKAAWGVAGVWTANEALRLTDIRARLMDGAAGPGGRLGYVRGLAQTTLESLLAKHRCEIAIRNPDLLYAVGGAEQDVFKLCEEAPSLGATRAGLIAVRIGSHTSRLEAACDPLQQALAASTRAPIAERKILLAGDGGPRLFSASNAMAKLASQVARPIDLAATLEALAEQGADRVLDLGPGHALAEMMKGVFPSIRCYAADGFRSIDGLRNWIALQ
nr:MULTISPECIES: acyltransferase domain-containing protein [Bradyrhizobium]